MLQLQVTRCGCTHMHRWPVFNTGLFSWWNFTTDVLHDTHVFYVEVLLSSDRLVPVITTSSFRDKIHFANVWAHPHSAAFAPLADLHDILTAYNWLFYLFKRRKMVLVWIRLCSVTTLLNKTTCVSLETISFISPCKYNICTESSEIEPCLLANVVRGKLIIFTSVFAEDLLTRWVFSIMWRLQ